MPRTTAIPVLVILALASPLVLAACGEEDAQLLPGATAREISVNLDSVRNLADEGDCVGAEGAAEQVRAQIEAVEVDPELKRALERGATRLNEVVAECEEPVEEGIEPATTPDEEEGEEVGGERRGGRQDDKGDKGRAQPPRPDAAPDRPTTPRPSPGGEKGGTPEPAPEEGEEDEDPSGGVSPAAPAGEG